MIADSAKTVDCSIVIPVYFNEASIAPTLEALEREVIAANPDRTFEVIFVDDGSGDRSLDVLREVQCRKPQLVRVIQLTRNFGQVSALLAGFSLARGKCVIPISADMQDPPRLMNDMLRAFFTDGYEVVICQRIGRDESWYRVATSRVFYWLMRRLCFPNMPLGGFDYVLLGRRSKDLLLRSQEAHPFLQGQILWPGFRTKYLEYHRQERRHGTSRWTFWKKLTYLVDGVTGYSFFPIRCMSVAGVLVALLGFLYAAVVFAARLFGGIPTQGWAPLMIAILVLGGFQLLTIGVIGEYVWRVLAQVRRREPYVIETVYGGESGEGGKLKRRGAADAREDMNVSDTIAVATSAPPAASCRRRACWLALMVAVPLAVQLATPMFGDMRTTYASAFQADQAGSFPANISWPFYMRGFGYKCLYYGLYRTAELAVDSRSLFAFELATRVLYYGAYVLLSAWFFWLLRQRIAAFGIRWLEAMLLFLVGVLATSHHVHQQPEELALLLTVGLTALSLSDNRGLNGLSGMFLPLMLSCKVLTIWPAVFPMLMVLATRDRNRILRVGASWVVFSVATALFYVFVIPQEIADTRSAAMNQSLLALDPRDVKDFVRNGVWSMAHIPFLGVAAVCFGWLLWRGAEEKQWKGPLLALGAIATAAPPVFIQSLHLRYHYLLFFPSAFLIALWTIRAIADRGRRSRVVGRMAAATLAAWVFFSAVDVEQDAYLWLWVKAAWHQNATLQDMDRQFHLSAEPEMLFLAPGDVNYVIRAKSHSRYFAPVLLQCAHWNKPLRDTPLFHEILADALAYHGTYIYLSDWLPLDHLPALEAKLKTEYEPATEKIAQDYPIPGVQLFRRRASAPK